MMTDEIIFYLLENAQFDNKNVARTANKILAELAKKHNWKRKEITPIKIRK